MTSSASQRLVQLRNHLPEPLYTSTTGTGSSSHAATSIESPAAPAIRTIAGQSNGPRVQDKVIIITGCNSPTGIGLASAYQFAQNGAQAIYICDISATHLNAHRDDLLRRYPRVGIHARQFDAADEYAVKNVVDDAINMYGRLDVFFANAGIAASGQRANSGGDTGVNASSTGAGASASQDQKTNPLKRFTDLSVAEFEHMMKVNVTSVFLALKHATPAMLITSLPPSPSSSSSSSSPPSPPATTPSPTPAPTHPPKTTPSGSFITTSSVAGLRSNAGGTHYSASKAAIISLVQTSCYELAGTGIRCNAICPGLIETQMTQPLFDQARKRGTADKIGQINPLRRQGWPDEVARVALFLASDESSYVNGQSWAVDGGLSAGLPMVVPGTGREKGKGRA